jgi:SH3-like domain-containing protein
MLISTISVLLLSLAPQEQAPVVAAAKVAPGQTATIRPFYDQRQLAMLKLEAGTPLDVIVQKVPWSMVRVPGGLVVWVHQDYVLVDKATALVKVSQLRARPRPSTDRNSHPIGKFQKGEVLQILDQQNEWLKVLAPERLGAWVLSNELILLEQTPVDWSKSWQQTAEARRKLILADAKPIVIVQTPTDQESEKVEQGAKESNSPVAESVNLPNPKKELSEPKILLALVDLARINRQPAQAVDQAKANLDRHAKQVTSDIDTFQPALLDNCDRVFSGVLLKQQQLKLLAKARRSLTRADALRRFYASAIEARARKKIVEQKGTPQNASSIRSKVGRNSELAKPESGVGEFVWVGHLRYRPHQYPKTPFVLVRGKREVLVHSFDGNFYMKDYLGRELVVKGLWRPLEGKTQASVLAISELRVLPRFDS